MLKKPCMWCTKKKEIVFRYTSLVQKRWKYSNVEPSQSYWFFIMISCVVLSYRKWPVTCRRITGCCGCRWKWWRRWWQGLTSSPKTLKCMLHQWCPWHACGWIQKWWRANKSVGLRLKKIEVGSFVCCVLKTNNKLLKRFLLGFRILILNSKYHLAQWIFLGANSKFFYFLWLKSSLNYCT